MKKYFLSVLGIVPFLLPQIVYAHAFGALYNLPVPFWLYLYGAAAALLVSFLIIGFFINQTKSALTYPRLNVSGSTFTKILVSDGSIFLLKIASVSLFLLTILTGLFGTSDSLSNFNMTFFWIIFLLGLTYLTALIGNIYSIINPWKIIIAWIEYFANKEFRGIYDYPKKLGYFPALVFYFWLIWIELFGAITPFNLSVFIIFYSLVTFSGIFAFGEKTWFEYGEFFNVFFLLIGEIAPFEKEGGKIYLRPPFIGLIKEQAESFSLLLFILFMLSSTAYDGFHATSPWVKFSIFFSDRIFFLTPDFSYQLIQQVGLILSPLVFLAIYLLLIELMKVLIKSELSIRELSLKFAFSLIPIALAYNIAHYYTLLLIQGQEIIRLASDPFGFGWNLFGTGNFVSNIRILDAGFVWHSQVAIILIGHIAAVYLAHLEALKTFPSHKKAVFSQLPILILMVIYTVVGLWILSQPIRGRV